MFGVHECFKVPWFCACVSKSRFYCAWSAEMLKIPCLTIPGSTKLGAHECSKILLLQCLERTNVSKSQVSLCLYCVGAEKSVRECRNSGFAEPRFTVFGVYDCLKPILAVLGAHECLTLPSFVVWSGCMFKFTGSPTQRVHECKNPTSYKVGSAWTLKYPRLHSPCYSAWSAWMLAEVPSVSALTAWTRYSEWSDSHGTTKPIGKCRLFYEINFLKLVWMGQDYYQTYMRTRVECRFLSFPFSPPNTGK